MSYFLPKNQSNPLDFFHKISYNILMSKVYYGEDNMILLFLETKSRSRVLLPAPLDPVKIP